MTFHPVIGLIAFAAIFGGALVGIFTARALPDHHLSNETRSAVSVAVAIVGTLAALVIGLMISSASSSFSARSRAVTDMSVDLVRIDRLLRRYGPEGQDARAKLRDYATAKTQELFPTSGVVRPINDATIGMFEALQDAIFALTPVDDKRQWLRSQALTLSLDLTRARWLLVEQHTGSTIPIPFLVLLIFWLSIVFASFGLFAPQNSTAVGALCLSSMAVAGGITMILEFDWPFSGLISISPAPMRDALNLLDN